MTIPQLAAEINLCSQNVENDLDSKSLELGFLIERRELISDFSYKFLSDCLKGSGFPYVEDHETTPKEDWKLRTWRTFFGFPNRSNYPHNGKNYDYAIDGHLEQMAQVASNPIHEKTLYMVVSSSLLNGGRFTVTSDIVKGAMGTLTKEYETNYLRPLYIGRTDNLYKRWRNHHRREKFNFLCQLDIELHLLMYFVYEEDANLKEMERILIRDLNPLMNDKPVLEKRKKMLIPNTMQGKVFPNSLFPSQDDIGPSV